MFWQYDSLDLWNNVLQIDGVILFTLNSISSEKPRTH